MTTFDPFADSPPIDQTQVMALQLKFLEGINTEDWVPILAGAIRVHHLAPFKPIYRQDDPVNAVYIVGSGLVGQYREEPVNGKTVRLMSRTVGPGRLLGHLEFLQGTPFATHARTEDMCSLLSIDIRAFSRLIYHFPSIRNKLYPQKIAARLSTFPFMSSLAMPPVLHPIVCAFLADETTVIEEIEPGQVLYQVGEPVEDIFLVHDGQVKVEQRGNPEETHLLGNGAMFGAALSASGFIGLGSVDRTMVHEAIAQTKTILYRLPYHSFKSITRIEPEEEIRDSIARREAIIDRLAVFSRIREREIKKTIAGFVSHIYFPNTHLLVQQGEIADSLWVLMNGQASIRALDKDGVQLSSAVATGPTYFAEQALLGQMQQRSTVEALPGSEWLRLHWRDWEAASKLLKRDLRQVVYVRHTEIVAEHEGAQPFDEHIADRSDQQNWRERWKSWRKSNRQQQQFDWLEPGETVIKSFRRHWIAFLRKNLPGIIVFAVMLGFFLLADLLPGIQYILRAIIIVLLIIDGLALAWGTIDYLNDWLTVTDMRVVHQEKVLFLIEWRKQAPLEQIQNVDFRTNWLGKVLDYGTLSISTAARDGTISFDYATNFAVLRRLIESQREVRRRSSSAASKLKIQRQLEERLGIAVDIPSRVYHGGQQTEDDASLSKRLARNLEAHLRRERDGRIIWRKHWLVLLPRLWFPLLVFFIMVALAVLPPLTELLGAPRETIPFLNALTIVGVLLTLIALANVIWVIADWRNDTYEVSEEEIVHVDRMPLGLSEDRKSANLGRIQNVEMSIPTTLHWLFNYGHVTCQTAAETGAFVFYAVPDPRAVAQEILKRMDAHQRRAERNAAIKRAQDLPDWFEMYNRIEPEVVEDRTTRSNGVT